jgi:hypothetical protein
VSSREWYLVVNKHKRNSGILVFYIMRPVYRTAAANELFIRNCLNEKLDNLAHALIPSQSTVLLCQRRICTG